MTATVSPDAWTQVIVALSIFVPVVVAAVLAIVVLRGKKDDPDEQRWRRLDEQRRDEERRDEERRDEQRRDAERHP